MDEMSHGRGAHLEGAGDQPTDDVASPPIHATDGANGNVEGQVEGGAQQVGVSIGLFEHFLRKTVEGVGVNVAVTHFEHGVEPANRILGRGDHSDRQGTLVRLNRTHHGPARKPTLHKAGHGRWLVQFGRGGATDAQDWQSERKKEERIATLVKKQFNRKITI